MKSYSISSWRFYLTEQSLGSDCCLLAADLFSVFELRGKGKSCRQVVVRWPFTPTPPVTLDGTQACFFLHERMCYGRLSLRWLATCTVFWNQLRVCGFHSSCILWVSLLWKGFIPGEDIFQRLMEPKAHIPHALFQSLSLSHRFCRFGPRAVKFQGWCITLHFSHSCELLLLSTLVSSHRPSVPLQDLHSLVAWKPHISLQLSTLPPQLCSKHSFGSKIGLLCRHQLIYKVQKLKIYRRYI